MVAEQTPSLVALPLLEVVAVVFALAPDPPLLVALGEEAAVKAQAPLEPLGRDLLAQTRLQAIRAVAVAARALLQPT